MSWGSYALALQVGFPWPGVMPISCGVRSGIARGVAQDIVSGVIDAGSRFCLRRLREMTRDIPGAPRGYLSICRCEFSRGLRGDSPRGSPRSKIGDCARWTVLFCALGGQSLGAPERNRGV